jgi:hypothetical protein
MCRNITVLRGLDPPASVEEIRAAALQYVRKVGGLQTVSPNTQRAVDSAVDQIAAATATLLATLPARRTAPAHQPPLRRIEPRT